LLDGTRSLDAIARELSIRWGESINAAQVAYIIEQKLAPQGLLSNSNNAPSKVNSKSPSILSVWIKTPLFSPQQLRPVTNLAQYLFAGPVPLFLLAILAIIHILTYWQLREELVHFDLRQLSPITYLLLYLIIPIKGLFHELGHLSACRRYGSHPGALGIAIYMIFPAFYADVSDAWRLPRRQRLVVDLAGMYFELLTTLVFFGLYWRTGILASLWAIIAIDMSLVSNLNPMFKLDGYWILTDLAGIPNLHTRLGEYLRYLGQLAIRSLRHRMVMVMPGSREQLGEKPKLSVFWQVHGYAKAVAKIYVFASTLYFTHFALVLLSFVPGLVRSYPALVEQAWQEAWAALSIGNVAGVVGEVLRVFFPTAMIVGLARMLGRALEKLLARFHKITFHHS